MAPNSVLEEIARKKPRTIPELLEIKGMGKERSDKFGKALLNIVILHERQESANSHVEGEEQPEAANSDAASEESSDGRQNHNSREILTNTGPFTPSPRRQPQLHTGLTSMVQRTSLLHGTGPQNDPFELDDSTVTLPMAQGSPGGARSASTTPSKRSQRPPVRNAPFIIA